MTKSLSQQLCELCGIEPHEEPSRTYDNDGEVEMYVTYPDFEKPRNFVKLLFLTAGDHSICTIVCDFAWVYSPSDFINALNDFLKTDKNSFNKLEIDKENMKKLIREAEWEW